MSVQVSTRVRHRPEPAVVVVVVTKTKFIRRTVERRDKKFGLGKFIADKPYGYNILAFKRLLVKRLSIDPTGAVTQSPCPFQPEHGERKTLAHLSHGALAA